MSLTIYLIGSIILAIIPFVSKTVYNECRDDVEAKTILTAVICFWPFILLLIAGVFVFGLIWEALDTLLEKRWED